MAQTKHGLPDMRKKENRYNPELVATFRELDSAKESFLQTLTEEGILEKHFLEQGYDALLTQGQLPDMRLVQNRHNPKLVAAYAQIVQAQEHIKKKALEISAQRKIPENLLSPFEGKAEETRGKKRKDMSGHS